MPKYQCDNCDYETDNENDFTHWNEIHHLGERLDVGGIVPAGECPECQCLVYLNEHPTNYADLVDAANNLLIDALERNEVRDEHTGAWHNDYRRLADALTALTGNDYGQTDYSDATWDEVEKFCEDTECVSGYWLAETDDDPTVIYFSGDNTPHEFSDAPAAMLAIDERRRK